jgi:hypothetical protein
VLDSVEPRTSRSKGLYLRDSRARHGRAVTVAFPATARDERICVPMWANESSTTVLDGLIVKGSRGVATGRQEEKFQLQTTPEFVAVAPA